MPEVAIGRIVHFRSRTGNYTVPAIITCTTETLAPRGVEVYGESVRRRETFAQSLEFNPPPADSPESAYEPPPLQGVPPLSSDQHVHLIVLTPGIPGMRVGAQDFKAEGILRQENANGVYQEWDIAPDPSEDESTPGTYRWPRVFADAGKQPMTVEYGIGRFDTLTSDLADLRERIEKLEA